VKFKDKSDSAWENTTYQVCDKYDLFGFV